MSCAWTVSMYVCMYVCMGAQGVSRAVTADIGRQGAGPVRLGEEVDVAQRHEQAVVGDDGHALVLHRQPVAPLLRETHAFRNVSVVYISTVSKNINYIEGF